MNPYTADLLRFRRKERISTLARTEQDITEYEANLQRAKDERAALKDHLTQIESDLLGAGERFDD